MRAMQRLLCRTIKELFGEEGDCLGMEIGVHRGRTGATLLEAFPKLRMIEVDPWRDQPESHPAHAYALERQVGQEHWDKLHAQAMEKLLPFGERAIIQRMTSEEALPHWKDGELGFVFIDGDHWACGRDMVLAWPKIKVGGFMLSHDWSHQRAQEYVGRWDTRIAPDNFEKFCGVKLEVIFGCALFKKTEESPKTIPVWLSGPLAGEPVTWPAPEGAVLWQTKPLILHKRRLLRFKAEDEKAKLTESQG